ncbi:transposon Tf2-6 polyprotein [Nephila pilipes]|uniref:Transposon Tf2-6 polyprotein n=1 Tax=Nephila pilipes TaxID=299642 RepID=A0A8X6TQ85_NEPPI|nr:transposon Tf2-6 polyprotein [Nephila pilipes]
MKLPESSWISYLIGTLPSDIASLIVREPEETLYHILKKQGTTFSTGSLTVCLAEGSKIEREVNTTCVKIRFGGRTLPLNLVVIPGAKNNNTLLGKDFLESSGIVLNVKRKTWFFDDQPKRQYHFVEQIQESCDAVKSNVSQTAAPLTVKETDHPVFSYADEVNHLTSMQHLELKDHPDQLRENESTHLTAIQKKKLNELLFRYRNSFYLGGESTPFIENYIDTQNHPPVKALRRRGRPARIIKPSSPTPANAQKHKGSQNTSSADP